MMAFLGLLLGLSLLIGGGFILVKGASGITALKRSAQVNPARSYLVGKIQRKQTKDI
jgi:hypothetical protein